MPILIVNKTKTHGEVSKTHIEIATQVLKASPKSTLGRNSIRPSTA